MESVMDTNEKKPLFDMGSKNPGIAFENFKHIPGSTYKDNSTLVVIPMRGVEAHSLDEKCRANDHTWCRKPYLHAKVVQAINGVMPLMNQKKAVIYTTGYEVGQAYNEMVGFALKHEDLSKWKYLMTIEDDNLPPQDALVRLIEAIEMGPFDAASGIYFTKGDYNMPMAYGDAREFNETGVLSFRPIDIRAALEKGQIMEVNGIGMGCALFRMELFRQIPPPWFVTVNDIIPDRGPCSYTQDLNFCERARRAGKRFVVDMRVKVGHMDVVSGLVY